MVHDGSGEPTMEEILASIRRIISEDEEESTAKPAEQMDSSVDEDVMDLGGEQENADEGEDILDLTEVVEENNEIEQPEEPAQSFVDLAQEAGEDNIEETQEP